MNKEFKLLQTKLATRSASYIGTCPRNEEGIEFIRCLRILHRSHGTDIFVGNRNPNRKQFRGTKWINSQGSIREAVATRHDIYLRNGCSRLPKWYLMTLGELQAEVKKVSDELFRNSGINPDTLGENYWPVFRLLTFNR